MLRLPCGHAESYEIRTPSKIACDVLIRPSNTQISRCDTMMIERVKSGYGEKSRKIQYLSQFHADLAKNITQWT